MKSTLISLLALVCCMTVDTMAKDSVATSQPTVAFRGEDLPIFAPPNTIKPKKAVPPEYPERERKDRIAGSAVVLALVGTDGKVVEAEVISSSPSASFGEAGKAAVLQWRYPQVFRKDTPTKFLVKIPLSFEYAEN